MLFETQKRLLTDLVNRGASALVKSTDPADPSRYTVLSSDSKKLTCLNVGLSIVVRQVVDRAGSDLILGAKFTHAIEGELLNAILTTSNIIDKIFVDFAPSSANEVIKSDDPNKAPVGLLGNLVVKFPGGEEWEGAVVDMKAVNIPTNPTFDMASNVRLVVNAGQLAKYVNQVGMAAGKDGGHPLFRNVLLRAVKAESRLDIVCSTDNHLAVAKTALKSATEDFFMTIPHVDMLQAVRVLDPEQDVEIVYNKGTPGTAIFCQDILYGDRAIGSLAVKITAPDEQFPKYEKLVGKLSVANIITFKTQQLRPICPKLEIPRPPHTNVLIDATKKVMILSKKEASRVKMTNVSIPINIVKGDAFQAAFTSRIMGLAINNADADEIEWSFSGPNSLSKMVLSPNLTTYFPPLNEP